MKIIKENSNSNIIIPIEVLKASSLLDSDDIELNHWKWICSNERNYECNGAY